MKLPYLFVDFDSYFASVEQQKRPELRGQPVGVVPTMAMTTCCIAASREAKAYGIRTGTGVAEAKHLCPHIQFVVAEHRHYVEMHEAIVNVVKSLVYVEEVKSIDEMICRLPLPWMEKAEAIRISHALKKKLAEEIGPYVTCSIGLSINPFLAKIASKMDKPNGITCIGKTDLPHVLHRLELRDIHGIGARMLKRLQNRKIDTVAKLCQATREQLHAAWGGVEGERIYAYLRGETIDLEETRTRHVSHSHVLPPNKRNYADALAITDRLLQKAATRMRHKGYYAGSLTLAVKFDFTVEWDDTLTFFETQDTRELQKQLYQLWKRCPRDYVEPSRVSVVLGKLNPIYNHTPSLFETPEDRRQVTLQKAIDTVNLRYGSRTLYYASAHEGINDAPMRIAFNHIPDLELERD